MPDQSPPAPPPSTPGRAGHEVALLADPATIDTFTPTRADRLWRWAIIGGFAALYLLNCGSFGLWDPWETHYGEVARNMLESYDWVNPWWGYRDKIGSEPIAGNWFYSKPIWIFWSEVVFLKLIGLSDWAFRLPVALVGTAMVATVYLTVERIIDRKHATLAALVVGLSPFVYMVSRQAQTDMPFVGTMTIAVCLCAVALFGRREPLSDRAFGRWTAAFVGFWAFNLLPQWAIIATDLADANAGERLTGLAKVGAQLQYNGIWHVAIYAPIGLAVLASTLWPLWRQRGSWDDALKDRSIRRYAMLSFYMVAAQATYAKGLLGFMLPGAILFTWFLVSSNWRAIARVELLRGIPLFLVTVLPWYVAMFCRHGRAYYNRFFIHDHFNRVGSGVHQIDHGTFEHFIKWLSFGLFPWAAFVPMAIVACARRTPGLSDRVQSFRLLVLSWFCFAFMLFTISSTKFHHYILPAVPALGMLVAFYLADLRQLSPARLRLHGLLAFGIFAVLLLNLLGDVQHLRNLFTYKYDRPLADNLPLDWQATIDWTSDKHPLLTWADTPFAAHVGGMIAWLLEVRWFRYDTFIKVIGAAAGISILAISARRLRRVGLVGLAATAALLAFWALNFYMPMLTPHWSQKYLFEAYYSDCTRHENAEPIREAYTPLVSSIGLPGIAEFFGSTPKRVCEEDIISWLITWRGETFYSNNEIRPINKEANQFRPYLQDSNGGKAFYVLMERGRTGGFASKLRGESRKLRDAKVSGWTDIRDWKVDLVHNSSSYFVVGRCVPVRDEPAAAGKAAPVPSLPRAALHPDARRLPGRVARPALPARAP